MKKESTNLRAALDKAFNNTDLQDIADIVADFNKYIQLHVNQITKLSKLLTPEQRETVKELLAYEKEVFLDTIGKYQ